MEKSAVNCLPSVETLGAGKDMGSRIHPFFCRNRHIAAVSRRVHDGTRLSLLVFTIQSVPQPRPPQPIGRVEFFAGSAAARTFWERKKAWRGAPPRGRRANWMNERRSIWLIR